MSVYAFSALGNAALHTLDIGISTSSTVPAVHCSTARRGAAVVSGFSVGIEEELTLFTFTLCLETY